MSANATSRGHGLSKKHLIEKERGGARKRTELSPVKYNGERRSGRSERCRRSIARGGGGSWTRVGARGATNLFPDRGRLQTPSLASQKKTGKKTGRLPSTHRAPTLPPPLVKIRFYTPTLNFPERSAEQLSETGGL